MSATKNGGDGNSSGDDDLELDSWTAPPTEQRQTLLCKRGFDEQVANSDAVPAASTKKSKRDRRSNSINLASLVSGQDVQSP
ncbi:hypothetical protein PF011_g12615 [Phytophthora fragariae]|uniref:Uncharacterized protein n=1 Tax=Phytophthora fragariae TaxID=53985 RepID=A0A6A3KK33_9STRA|nr:hypothetical protein PF011_g12615 [Phytophthora fragariae]